MGKKMIKIGDKTYTVDEKDLEEVEVVKEEEAAVEEAPKEEAAAEEAPAETPAEEAVEKSERFENALDEAAEKIVKNLGVAEISARLDKLETPAIKEVEKKVAGIIDFEKLMKKDVSEMTANEKIIGFFQAALRSDREVLKALSEGVAADGGYLFPDEFRAEIIRDLEDVPHMRSLVRVIPMTRDVMNIPTLISGPQVSWTAELAAKSTTTARFGQATLTAYKMAAIMYASDELIADAAGTFDVVKLIISLFSEALGNEEDRVITAGTGAAQPTGYASGGLGIQAVACTGNLDFDDIISLIYLLPQKYQKNATFTVHRNNISQLRQVKDTNGRYLWQEPLSAGQPATIYGHPVREDNNLSEAEIYFGDFKHAYWLGDRSQMAVKISTDTTQAFTRDETAIRVVQRIAGTVVEARALKVLNTIP